VWPPFFVPVPAGSKSDWRHFKGRNSVSVKGQKESTRRYTILPVPNRRAVDNPIGVGVKTEKSLGLPTPAFLPRFVLSFVHSPLLEQYSSPCFGVLLRGMYGSHRRSWGELAGRRAGGVLQLCQGCWREILSSPHISGLTSFEKEGMSEEEEKNCNSGETLGGVAVKGRKEYYVAYVLQYRIHYAVYSLARTIRKEGFFSLSLFLYLPVGCTLRSSIAAVTPSLMVSQRRWIC